MKTLFVVVLCLGSNLSAQFTTSDSPEMLWTTVFGGGGQDDVKAMVTDDDGNIYLAGTITFLEPPANLPVLRAPLIIHFTNR